jgi:CubicO group peptidase (beta-lactamase class C family)
VTAGCQLSNKNARLALARNRRRSARLLRLALEGPAVRATFARLAPAELRPHETFEQFLARTQTTSLLVLRSRPLLYEGYFNGHQPDTVQELLCMAKSVISILIGLALAEHKLPSIDAPAEDLLPDVRGLRNSGITPRDLLDMTAGFAIRKGGLLWPFNAP